MYLTFLRSAPECSGLPPRFAEGCGGSFAVGGAAMGGRGGGGGGGGGASGSTGSAMGSAASAAMSGKDGRAGACVLYDKAASKAAKCWTSAGGRSERVG